MCPIQNRDLTQHDPGTGSSPWLPAIVTSGQHTSKIVPTNSCITSKVRATSSALMQSWPLGEDGDGRLDDKANRTNRPSGSKRWQSRAAGRLGGDGDFETVRKRGKGSGGLGSAGCSTYQGQVCFKLGKRRRLHRWTLS